MENMILIMIDECGDEVEFGRYYLAPELELDEDAVQGWEERKIEKAALEYPEARGFYFEDRRNWNRAIMMDIREWL